LLEELAQDYEGKVGVAKVGEGVRLPSTVLDSPVDLKRTLVILQRLVNLSLSEIYASYPDEKDTLSPPVSMLTSHLKSGGKYLFGLLQSALCLQELTQMTARNLRSGIDLKRLVEFRSSLREFALFGQRNSGLDMRQGQSWDGALHFTVMGSRLSIFPLVAQDISQRFVPSRVIRYFS
jgi:hypothetical protein